MQKVAHTFTESKNNIGTPCAYNYEIINHEQEEDNMTTIIIDIEQIEDK